MSGCIRMRRCMAEWFLGNRDSAGSASKCQRCDLCSSNLGSSASAACCVWPPGKSTPRQIPHRRLRKGAFLGRWHESPRMDEKEIERGKSLWGIHWRCKVLLLSFDSVVPCNSTEHLSPPDDTSFQKHVGLHHDDTVSPVPAVWRNRCRSIELAPPASASDVFLACRSEHTRPLATASLNSPNPQEHPFCHPWSVESSKNSSRRQIFQRCRQDYHCLFPLDSQGKRLQSQHIPTTKKSVKQLSQVHRLCAEISYPQRQWAQPHWVTAHWHIANLPFLALSAMDPHA